MKLKAVLFDLDGTLIDSKKDIAAAANAARLHFGMVPLDLETLVGYIGWGVEHLNKKALGTEDPAILAEGLKVLGDHYKVHCVDQTIVFPGTRELLESLVSRGIKLGLVSNKPHELTQLTLQKLGLFHFFTAVLGADATQNKKPNPDPLLKVLKKLGVTQEEAVMIGDSSVDLEAARAAGLRVGLVAHGFVPKEKLVSLHPDWLVDSLNQLTDLLH